MLEGSPSPLAFPWDLEALAIQAWAVATAGPTVATTPTAVASTGHAEARGASRKK